MRSCFPTLAVIGLLLAWAASAQAQGGALPKEAEQVLFIIDDSSSMTETAFDPNAPLANRWEVVQRVFPQWLERLRRDTLVGALSVGGECGAPPAINLPIGTDRTLLATEIAKAQPHGDTNLNAALEASPKFFAPGVQGSKRIILLSDGLNTCPPYRSTCEIAKELHRNHGIIIDVVAWITDPQMVDEFRCVATFTGGTFTTPQTIEEWIKIPLPSFDPWPYVVLSLGFITFLLTARVLYRHGVHALGWGTGSSALAGGLFLLLGTLALYLVLFVKAGLWAALIGGAVLASMLAVAFRRGLERLEPATRSPSPWGGLVVVLFAFLLAARPDVSASPTATLTARVEGPRYHHILALDMSGTVHKFIDEMKFLLARYAEMYARPGEEISLVGFGMDEAGSVKELHTFTIPLSGSTLTLNRILDDLSIQNPKRTRTYFKPLADFLNQFLQGVRLQPVVVVVSDGKSDGFQDALQGLVDFKEIPFESFGQRGVYAAPGISNWKVAVAGGNDLDLTALFQKPLAARRTGGRFPGLLSPVIDPELIEPSLLVETDETVVLRPTWNPFSRRIYGTLSIFVRNERVARFRTFRVELRRGNDTLPLGSVNNTLIDQNAKSFKFPVTLEATGQGTGEAVVQVILDQGGTTRTIYPNKPTTIKIEGLSYFAALWLGILPLSIALLTLLVVVYLALRHLHQRERNRKEIIKVLGGQGIPLTRFQPITIGGDGCSLVVEGVPAEMVLATAEWTGTRGELTLRERNGVRIKVNGADVSGSTSYRLGQPIQFIDANENIYNVTLYPGTNKDIGFGTNIPGKGNSKAPGAFEGFGEIGFADSDSGFRSVPLREGGGSMNPDTYI